MPRYRHNWSDPLGRLKHSQRHLKYQEKWVEQCNTDLVNGYRQLKRLQEDVASQEKTIEQSKTDIVDGYCLLTRLQEDVAFQEKYIEEWISTVEGSREI